MQAQEKTRKAADYGWSLAVHAGAGIGAAFSHHGRASLSLERRFADRFSLELAMRVGFAGELTSLEPGLRLGVLLHLAERWDLLLGWRVGYAGIHLDNFTWKGWAHAVATGPVVELRWAISPRWELRLLSLGLTGYWSGYWALVFEPVIGAGVRF